MKGHFCTKGYVYTRVKKKQLRVSVRGKSDSENKKEKANKFKLNLLIKKKLIKNQKRREQSYQPRVRVSDNSDSKKIRDQSISMKIKF